MSDCTRTHPVFYRATDGDADTGCQHHGRATRCFGRWINCHPYPPDTGSEGNRAHVRALLTRNQPAYAATLEAAAELAMEAMP